MGIKTSNLMAIVWPPERRRQKKAREQAEETQRWVEERNERVKERAREYYEREQKRKEYERHVAAYPLNGVGTHKVNGINDPIIIGDLRKAALDRLSHAAEVNLDACIDRAAPGDVEAMTGHLHPSTLRGLMDREDQVRQRNAADSIRQARLALDPEQPLFRYATAVAEAAVMQMSETATEAEKVAEMVCARAILLRSADYRWQLHVRGALMPLSHRPPRPR